MDTPTDTTLATIGDSTRRPDRRATLMWVGKRILGTGDALAGWIVGITSLVVQIPFLNRGISYTDEGSILAIAESLRHGDTLYRDHVTIVGPLTYELVRRVFDLFGTSLLTGRALQAILFSLTTFLVYRILRVFMGTRWAVVGALSLLPLKSLGFPFWTIVNYSQIAMVPLLVSILMTLRFLASHRLTWLTVAGLNVGMTLITKQNLGVLFAATLLGTITLDAVLAPRPRTPRVLERGSVLIASSFAAPLIVVAYFWSRGALDDLLAYTVVSLRDTWPEYRLPLPFLDVWSLHPAALGRILFAYFPVPVLDMVWEGRVNLAAQPLLIISEIAVKAVYAAPLIVLGVGLASAWRGWRSDMPRSEWAQLVLVVASGGVAYFSTLYRPDWAHLMNVYPLFLLAGVVALYRVAGGRARTSWIPMALWLSWFTVGLAAAGVVMVVNQAPVESRRGRLFVSAPAADDTNRLLKYLEGRPRQERILMMRAAPLYYFLSERPIPIAFDEVLPGFFKRTGDDERVAANVRSVDRVIYNPAVIPTLTMPITEYAPQTAVTLAEGFQFVEVLSPSAFVLTPLGGDHRDDVAMVDWGKDPEAFRLTFRTNQGTEGAAPAFRFERTSWMMFNVVTSPVAVGGGWTCLVTSHAVGLDEAISVTPMVQPDRWISRRDMPAHPGDPAWDLVDFEITIRDAGSTASARSKTYRAAPIGTPARIALDDFLGHEVEISFCAGAARPRAGTDFIPAGWAEAKILRAVGPSLASKPAAKDNPSTWRAEGTTLAN